jgi:hypothetical protein
VVARKNLIYALSVGIGVIAFAFSGEIGKIVGRLAVERYLEGQTQGAIEKAQEEAAKQIRAQLPMRVDDVTTLERVVDAGAMLLYQYNVSLTESDLDASWHLNQKNMLITNVCKEPGMRLGLKNGAKYKYDYFGKNGILIAESVVAETDCSGAPR